MDNINRKILDFHLIFLNFQLTMILQDVTINIYRFGTKGRLTEEIFIIANQVHF